MSKIMFSLTPSSKPWQTWHVELQKEINEQLARNVGKLEISQRREYCNLHMVEWEEGITELPVGNAPIVFYMEQPEAFSDFIKLVEDDKHRVYVLSECVEVLNAMVNFGIEGYYWAKPTRVPKNYWFNMENPQDRETLFTVACNASREQDNIVEIIKTYFGMCLYETEDGEMLNNHDLEIFSAQELPVEPFNTLRFMGLQPNPLMFKRIRKSILFISPYNGTSVPSNVLDAIFLGTPVLMRDTPSNRAAFDLDSSAFFSTSKDLARRIKTFKEISEDEINDIAEENLNRILDTCNYDPEVALENLRGIIEKEILNA